MSQNYDCYDVLCHRETCQHIEVMIYGLWEKPDPSVGLIGSLLDVEVYDMKGNELDVEEYCSIRGQSAEPYIQEVAAEWYRQFKDLDPGTHIGDGYTPEPGQIMLIAKGQQ